MVEKILACTSDKRLKGPWKGMIGMGQSAKAASSVLTQEEIPGQGTRTRALAMDPRGHTGKFPAQRDRN